MLLTKGYADDGDVEHTTEQHMRKPNPESTHEKPDDVHYSIQTATGGLLAYLGAKGPQCHLCHLDGLQSEGNADDGDHHGDAGQDILYCRFKATENQPYDIS